jgi:hypothetical protein
MTAQQLQQLLQRFGTWLKRYYPLLISLVLVTIAMSGVSNNYTAQLLLIILLAQPLSVWLANHSRTH